MGHPPVCTYSVLHDHPAAYAVAFLGGESLELISHICCRTVGLSRSPVSWGFVGEGNCVCGMCLASSPTVGGID